MTEIINKENIIKAFDKASGFGEEFGNFTNYVEIQPIRTKFIRIIGELFNIEMAQLTSGLSNKALSMITEDLKKHYKECVVCGCVRDDGGVGLCKNINCPLSEPEHMV